MLKDLRGWIKHPLPGSSCRLSKSCLHFRICLTDFAETVAEEPLHSLAPGAEPSPGTCPSSDMGTQSQAAFLHYFPPRIINWLMCTLITFQEDLFYLCCASVGKALNKYFTYFIMTMNGINHPTGIVLQLMFTLSNDLDRFSDFISLQLKMSRVLGKVSFFFFFFVFEFHTRFNVRDIFIFEVH